MQLKINLKRIIAVCMLIILANTVFIGNLNSVYGKINEVYISAGEVGSIDIDSAVADAPILEVLARFVYAIAGYIERIVGFVVKLTTGVNIFPWADRVVFNTMPLLDINFFSPENGSLFRGQNGIDTNLGRVIRNIYYTIFTVALGFFGVIVGILALKLAISSIASEKSKYKQAITNWLLALILLFTSHYLISFIFFVNEKMVEIASSLVNIQDLDINTEAMTDDEREKIVRSVLKKALANYSQDIGFDELTESVVYYYPYGELSLDEIVQQYSDYYYHGLGDNIEKMNAAYEEYCNDPNKPKEVSSIKEWLRLHYNTKEQFLEWLANDYATLYTKVENEADPFKALVNNYISKDLVLNNPFNGYIYALCIGDTWSSDYWGIYGFKDGDAYSEKCTKLKSGSTDSALERVWFKYIMNLYGDASISADIDIENEKDMFAIFIDAAYIMLLDQHYGLKSGDITEELFIDGLKHLVATKHFYGVSRGSLDEHYQNLWKHVNNTYTLKTSSHKGEAFTGIADYFKNAVTVVYLDGDEEVKNFSPIPAILYSIFVIQSIMYFIAYLKRFFYVITLVLLAPIVIIYDFLTKTTMA